MLLWKITITAQICKPISVTGIIEGDNQQEINNEQETNDKEEEIEEKTEEENNDEEIEDSSESLSIEIQQLSQSPPINSTQNKIILNSSKKNIESKEFSTKIEKSRLVMAIAFTFLSFLILILLMLRKI